MKTAVTVTKCVQTGIDSYKDVKKTKVFDDDACLFSIKLWIHDTMESNIPASEISLSTVEFSDVTED